MTQRSYSMADAYRSIYEKKEDTKDWPSIKDAKEPKKTNVKYDKHMGLHAPTIKEALELLDEEDAEYFLMKLEAKGLSIDDQMRISKEYNRKSPEEKKKANQAALGNTKKAEPKKDTRSDSEKMADATDERPGSFYRRFGK
jgi:hypothetical protein